VSEDLIEVETEFEVEILTEIGAIDSVDKVSAVNLTSIAACAMAALVIAAILYCIFTLPPQ
jgi:hypothetical protein